MKIIEFAPYAYIKGHSEFNKTTGAAFAISDIAEGLAETNDVILLTQSAITKGFIYKKMVVQKKTWIDVFKGFRIHDFIDGIKVGNGFKASLKYRLKIIYYFVSQGHAEKVLKKEKPDIAHIESIGFYTYPYIRACINCGVPFVITSHGLSSFLDDSEIDYKQKKMEREFFRLSDNKNLLISCVSAGMIDRMRNAFDFTCKNIRVIGNCVGCFNPVDKKIIDKIRKTYKVNDDQKVVICLGSICKRKNQEQVIRAYALLSDEDKEQIKLFFIGSGPLENKIRQYAKENNLTNVVFTGYVNHEELSNYYSIADVNITASKDEGFGLPIIEAYAFGVPTVAFNDIDAVNDLMFDHGMYLANERNDKCLCDTMLESLKQKSDYRINIIKHSARYSRKSVADKYIKMFQDALQRGSLSLTNKDIEGIL